MIFFIIFAVSMVLVGCRFFDAIYRLNNDEIA